MDRRLKSSLLAACALAAEVRANGIEGLILRIEGKTGAATKNVSVRS